MNPVFIIIYVIRFSNISFRFRIHSCIHIYDGFRLMNLVLIIIHIHSVFQYHISIPISLSYYLFKDILIHVFTHVYSFLYSFMCAHSYPHLHMHSCKLIHTLIHVYSFMYTHLRILIHKFIYVYLFTYTHS